MGVEVVVGVLPGTPAWLSAVTRASADGAGLACDCPYQAPVPSASDMAVLLLLSSTRVLVPGGGGARAKTSCWALMLPLSPGERE
ncbi:hypothetical protein D9M71_367830 [compost metagenome]